MSVWGQEGREEGRNPLPPQRTEVGCAEKEEGWKRVKLRRLREEMIAGRVQGGLEQIPQRQQGFIRC